MSTTPDRPAPQRSLDTTTPSVAAECPTSPQRPPSMHPAIVAMSATVASLAKLRAQATKARRSLGVNPRSDAQDHALALVIDLISTIDAQVVGMEAAIRDMRTGEIAELSENTSHHEQ